MSGAKAARGWRWRLANEAWHLRAAWRLPRWRDRLWLLGFLFRSRLDTRFGATLPITAPRPPARIAPDPVPRRIWMLWMQGWDDAPELVRFCRHSWEAMNPGWEVVAIDATAAEALTGTVSLMAGREAPVAATANLVRFSLLSRHGGVWADATTLCARPLDRWLPALMTSGFFAFGRPAPDRVQESWFLASTPGHLIPTAWLRASRLYWQAMRAPHLYFWCTHIFADLCRRDAEFGALWAATPQRDPAPMLQLLWHWHDQDLAARLDRLDAEDVPVYKLNWRRPLDGRTRPVLRDFLERRIARFAAARMTPE